MRKEAFKPKERPDTVAGPGSRGGSTAADAEEEDAACLAAFGGRSQELGACCGHEGRGTAATLAPGRKGSCASCCPAPARARTWSPSPCHLPSCTACRVNLHSPPARVEINLRTTSYFRGSWGLADGCARGPAVGPPVLQGGRAV
eukprot:208685-Lingulodinium_polyedra.AAC.1